LRRREAGRLDRRHAISRTIEPGVVACHPHRQRIDVAGQHLDRNAFAAAIASTPVPVPTSSTRRGRQASALDPQQQATARGAVMAGAERQRRFDLDAELVGRNAQAVMLAVHDEAPRAHRHQLLERGLDPILASTVSKRDVLRDIAAGGETYELADLRLIGRSAKCTETSQRPSGRSNAAIAACPSRKISFSKSTTCLATCSLPMAKVARLVLG